MWHERITNKDEEPAPVTFEIGDRDPKTPNNEEEPEWECVWKCHTATPVHHMAFSPDGTLFATSGKSDRLVKIWYENKHGKCIKIIFDVLKYLSSHLKT